MSTASVPSPAPRRPRCRAHGFTLVELLCALVILAIIAALGVQTVLDLRKDAQNTKLRTVAHAFGMALANARGLCNMMGTPGQRTSNLAATGGALDFDLYCFPRGTSWNNGASTSTHCTQLMQVLVPTVSVSVTPQPGIDFLATSAGTGCYFDLLNADGTVVDGGGSGAARIGYFAGSATSGQLYWTDVDLVLNPVLPAGW